MTEGSGGRLRRTGILLAAIAATAAVAVGSAVLFDGNRTDGGGTQADPAAAGELAAADGEVCPAVMPQAAGSDGFGTDEAAPGSPDLPDPDQGWVCRYDPGTGRPGADENGSYVSWQREGQAVALGGEALATLSANVSDLEPSDPDVCSSDLGPRWLLVTSYGGDLTGVSIDDFGCREVRITDHPAEVEPGEATQPGTVPGVLAAPDGFLGTLKAAFGSGADSEPVPERLDIEMGHCWVEPVAFDGEQWNVPFDDQFGWGGLEPKNWQGTGVMTRVADDEARFDDDGGSSVTFLLVDDHTVTPVERAGCD